MTLHIEVNAEMEARLAADASLLGMELESYARRLLQEALSTKSRSGKRASQEEFCAFLDALASKAPDVPHLRTETFDRAMIYGEHD